MISESAIGGGIVRRTFTLGERVMKTGDMLTRAEVLAIRIANRNSLIDHGKIEIYAANPNEIAEPGERHVVRAPGVGSRLYDVIEGRKLNSEPLTREDAEALAFPAPN